MVREENEKFKRLIAWVRKMKCNFGELMFFGL